MTDVRENHFKKSRGGCPEAAGPIVVMAEHESEIMNEPQSQYLVLFRNNEWYRELSPAEIQKVMSEWMSWCDGMVADGRCLGGQSLERDGHVIRGSDRRITDGPYAETKESVAGYIILTVQSMEEALELARLCPGLPYGATVEVRKLMEECGASRMAKNPEMAASV